MRKIFKPEDFVYIWDDRAGSYQEASAKIANEKLNKLIESWPVFYCSEPDDKENSFLYVKRFKENCDTHKVYLAFIEEIPKEPCIHEPYIKYHPDAVGVYPNYSECQKCGVKLKATWSEA